MQIEVEFSANKSITYSISTMTEQRMIRVRAANVMILIQYKQLFPQCTTVLFCLLGHQCLFKMIPLYKVRLRTSACWK